MENFNKQLRMSDEQKVTVLLQALNERNTSLHTIRERVQNVSLWVLGLFVTAGGWLVQADTILTVYEKWVCSIAILTVVLILRFFYLADLEKGFKTQQRIQVQLEEVLGFFSPEVFRPEALYPKEWKRAGLKNGKGNFFAHNHLLIYVGTLLLILSIWLA